MGQIPGFHQKTFYFTNCCQTVKDIPHYSNVAYLINIAHCDRRRLVVYPSRLRGCSNRIDSGVLFLTHLL